MMLYVVQKTLVIFKVNERRPALNVAQKLNLGPHEREVSYVWWQSSSQAKYSQTCERLPQTELEEHIMSGLRRDGGSAKMPAPYQRSEVLQQEAQLQILRQETTPWFQGFSSWYWCQMAYNDTQQRKGRWNLVTRYIQLLGYHLG